MEHCLHPLHGTLPLLRAVAELRMRNPRSLGFREHQHDNAHRRDHDTSDDSDEELPEGFGFEAGDALRWTPEGHLVNVFDVGNSLTVSHYYNTQFHEN